MKGGERGMSEKSLAEILRSLLEESKIVKKTQKYDWADVIEKLRKIKVFNVPMVQKLSGVRRFQQARQWVESKVKYAVDERTGKKQVVNENGLFVRFKSADGRVYYTFEENVKGV